MLIFASGGLSADSYTFSLIPSNGSINGAPGSLIGWGYSITNDSASNWLDALAVNAGIFRFATLDSGDYFDFPLVAPDSTVTVSFTPAGASGFGAGLAALTWDFDAPLNFTNSGNFVLSACWANSSGTCITAAPDEDAAYSATAASAPEPSTVAMVGLMVVVLSISVFITRGSCIICLLLGRIKAGGTKPFRLQFSLVGC